MKFRVQPHRYYPQVSAQVRKEKLLVLFWEELMRREKKEEKGKGRQKEEKIKGGKNKKREEKGEENKKKIKNGRNE